MDLSNIISELKYYAICIGIGIIAYEYFKKRREKKKQKE